MKRFLFLLSSVLLVTVAGVVTDQVHAQGTYNCFISGFGTSRACNLANNCDTAGGYEPPSNVCTSLTNCDPTTPTTCVSTGPTNTPPASCSASYPIFFGCRSSGPPSGYTCQSRSCGGSLFSYCCTNASVTTPPCPGPLPNCNDSTFPCPKDFFCNTAAGSSIPGCSGQCNPSTGGPPTANSFTGFCNPSNGLPTTDPKAGGIRTPFGCLNITGKATVSTLLGWAVSIGGGIAFLLIVYAAFMMTTAAGDPKRIKAAQELLAAALGGLTLIVLSVVLLNFIGVKVLNLVGLGF